jgi:hypothetical protein
VVFNSISIAAGFQYEKRDRNIRKVYQGKRLKIYAAKGRYLKHIFIDRKTPLRG